MVQFFRQGFFILIQTTANSFNVKYKISFFFTLDFSLWTTLCDVYRTVMNPSCLSRGSGVSLKRCCQVKKSFKALNSHCRVNKGYEVILEFTVYTCDDLWL